MGGAGIVDENVQPSVTSSDMVLCSDNARVAIDVQMDHFYLCQNTRLS